LKRQVTWAAEAVDLDQLVGPMPEFFGIGPAYSVGGEASPTCAVTPLGHACDQDFVLDGDAADLV